MNPQDFKRPLLALLAEAHGLSDAPTGFFLDSGRSGLFGQIDALDAATASRPLVEGHETIAAHCGHLLFTLDFFLAIDRGEQVQPDWPSSWADQVVDEAEWARLREDLEAAYGRLADRLQAREDWPQPAIGAALMMLAHTAYHVGVIEKLVTLTRR